MGRAAAATAPALPRRSAPPAARPQLRVVESPADRRRRVLRTRRAVVFGTLITAVGVFTIVAFHVMLAQGQVRLAKLQTELSSAEREYQQAQYANAKAASPERIVAKAAQIGLVTPARPPVAVAVPDPAAPSTGESGSRTLDGYANVKKSLADGP
jgi:cell division protein FtsL